MEMPLIHVPLHAMCTFVFSIHMQFCTNFDHEHTDDVYLCGSSFYVLVLLQRWIKHR